MGHRIDTWAKPDETRRRCHLVPLQALSDEAKATTDNELMWSVPTARSDRSFNWGEAAISPDAVGEVITGGLHIPFFFEYELRARHPRGVAAQPDGPTFGTTITQISLG